MVLENGNLYFDFTNKNCRNNAFCVMRYVSNPGQQFDRDADS